MVKQCFQCKEPVVEGTPMVYLDTGEIHFNDTSALGDNADSAHLLCYQKRCNLPKLLIYHY